MAIYDSCRAVTGIAGSAVTQYKFVVMASDGKFDHTASAQGRVDGIAGESAAADGDPLPVVVPDGGVTKVMAGAATTRGGLVATDASGRAIDFSSGTVNRIAVGVFWEAASAAGQIIKIQFIHKTTDGGT